VERPWIRRLKSQTALFHSIPKASETTFWDDLAFASLFNKLR
jgi:hypothetical protein